MPGVFLAWAISACSFAQEAAPVSANAERIVIDAVQVPLDPRNPSETRVGEFTYAGGLALSSASTTRLHELSDLVVRNDRTITAVGDAGVVFDARLVLDAGGTLVGVTDATLTTMTGEDGRALTGEAADAEGLAVLPNGDLLVSFEKQPRILLYPRSGERPRAVPSPPADLPRNGGMEALAVEPDGGDVYVVGAEESGATWTCSLTGRCSEAETLDKPGEFGLVAMERLRGGLMAYLLRAYDPVRGSRITLSIRRGAAVVAQLELARPLTVDNFEGVASIEGAAGTQRFYLLSDDNAGADQRTLLLAFDWRPR